MSTLALQLIAENKASRSPFLDLGNCGLTELPQELAELTYLEVLNLSDSYIQWNEEKQESEWKDSQNTGEANHLSDIAILANLVNLKALYCYGAYNNKWAIQDISPLAQLTSLTFLSISQNQIQDISPLEQLTSLTFLSISQNQIQDISPLAKLTNLTKLDISQNQIQDISPISQLTNLTSLDIWSNQIQDISPLAKLTNLTNLDIWHNQIQDINPLMQLINLTELSISHNQIQDINSIRYLINLTVLSISNNQIQDINSIKTLTNLTFLSIYTNQIQDISSISQLTNLDELHISDNKIHNINSITHLLNLTLISASNNQIQDLSPLLPLYKKENEIYINIEHNPLIHPPLEVVQRGRESIIAYLEALQSGEELQFLREAKLVIVGEGGTGKTSLLAKMKDINNDLPQETERTKGIEVAPLHFTDKEGNDFQMNVWDFGGQGIYQATHQFFLSKRSLYILLDDTRRSDTTLQDPTFNYWLQVSELYGGDSPLLIVQNEKEDFSKQINFADMQQRFPFVKSLYATNIKKTNKDWNRLQRDIQDYISRLPHIGTWMRKEWIAIRQGLLTLSERRDYVAIEEYEDICKEHNITEESETLMLSALLHDLGTILHFQGNSLLKQRLILKKEWATEAIYKVLDCEIIKQDKKGQFTEADLARIWCDKKWKNSIPQLLALMDEFEISYLLSDSKPKTYLAPLLLPAETPVYEWDKQGNLVLRYKYRFMPQGILSRLIVRLHRFVKDSTKAWKTGVLLYHEDSAIAELRDVYGESEIRIAVRGTEKKEFMHIIRSELDALNATFPFQDFPDREKAVQKLIPCVCETCQKETYPHYYEYDDLKRRIEKQKKTVECKISYEDVPVKNILDAVLFSEKVALAKEIREYVRIGKPEKAFEALRKYESTANKDETLLLSGRFERWRRLEMEIGKDNSVEWNTITKSLLDICRELENE